LSSWCRRTTRRRSSPVARAGCPAVLRPRFPARSSIARRMRQRPRTRSGPGVAQVTAASS
jgi:hypothetical protein